MKKSSLIAMLVIVTGVFFYACKDNLINETADKGSNDKSGARIMACTPIPLSGVYTSPLNLTSGNTYLLQGNVVIDGTTLTIDDGVIIFGEKSSNGALIVLPDAQINAAGTSSNPIIFTSDEALSVNNPAPGDWAGVFLLGQGVDNGVPPIQINGTGYQPGGSTAASSVGTFKYVQIHFAGGGGGIGSDRLSESALVIASAGSTSVIDHVQVTESARDGVGVWGGNANLRNIINYKVKRTDYMFSYGYTGTGQFLGGHKADASANTSGALAYGMDITNQLFTPSSSTAPLTSPSLSNVSLLGGNFCEEDATFTDAIIIRENGNSQIRNSIVSSYSNYALILSEEDVIAKTASNLVFSYNSFHQITNSPQYSSVLTGVSWIADGGCGSSMTQWMTGNGTPGCSEFDNQFTVGTLGYNVNSLCSACPFTPDFALNTATTTLDDPNFEDWNSSVFTEVAYRGAFGSTDWTLGWTDFCAVNTEYCV